ncbi:protein yellow [Anthonomus grandis grandis]|uniref:protein yellow n=1 Tax=Anthonomus grandis grandis TaxID=2921223 RepID=UPI0021668CC8|nr:protein yellow [Anthonomus grandis grandis]
MMARMVISTLIPLLLLVTATRGNKLNISYQWKIVDFDFGSSEKRQAAIDDKSFIPENNIPMGLEVYKNRIFVTLPRWKFGVAASLAYIDRATDPMDSPLLKPYPNWDAHRAFGDAPPEIVSPFRVRADQCGRLWVPDTGIEGLLENEPKVNKNTTIMIYDLHNDQLIRTFEIPFDQTTEDSFFANLAIEDEDCENTFAYFADLGGPGLIVYSWKQNRSWKVKHNYFHIKPTAGDMNVMGISFQWSDGIFGLALRPEKDGFSTLFFHPLTSFDEFSVSTRILRDESLASNRSNYHEFKFLGGRGPKSQSGVSFLDKKTGVLFYALINLNAVACWRTTNPAYTMESQGRIYMNNVTMVFPNDIKVDSDGYLWVLSNKLPQFMYSSLDYNDVNFRIMSAKVSEAIKGTACASKLVKDPDIMNKISKITGDDKIKGKASGGSRCDLSRTVFLVFAMIFLR